MEHLSLEQIQERLRTHTPVYAAINTTHGWPFERMHAVRTAEVFETPDGPVYTTLEVQINASCWIPYHGSATAEDLATT